MAARRDDGLAIEPDFAARQSVLWAVAWLVGGATITFLASVLAVRPSLSPLKFLSFAHLREISDVTLVFGWLGCIALAALFALIPRLTEIQLHNEPLGAATTLTWSVALTGGVIALLFRKNQGRPLAELAVGAKAALALLLVVALYNAGVTVVRRREKTLYVSGWFLLAAALVGPLVFATAVPTLSGATATIVHGFYLNGVEMLWMLPIGLAIAHYVVPVETGNALASASLARITFWSLLAAGGWAGQRFYLKNSVPDYLGSIAVAMTVVLLIPVLSAAVNLLKTGGSRWNLVTRAYGLRFVATGIAFLLGWIVLVVLTTVPAVNKYVGLTAWRGAVSTFGVVGVFTAFGLGLVYHVYPLMVGRDWYSRSLASFHYWATVVGVLGLVAVMLATGTAQWTAGPNASGGIFTVLHVLQAGAWLVIAAGQWAFGYNTMRTASAGPYLTTLTVADVVGANA